MRTQQRLLRFIGNLRELFARPPASWPVWHEVIRVDRAVTRAVGTVFIAAVMATALVGLFVATTSPAEGQTNPSCTIVGTEGDDDLSGTPGDDVICGKGGDDTVFGGAGNDTIFGGAGEDTLIDDVGNDTLVGGEDDDAMNAGSGDDEMVGNEGEDSLAGGEGDDAIVGGEGDDLVSGQAGDDVFSGKVGDDLIFGGEGDDLHFGGDGADRLIDNAGDDRMVGGENADRMASGSGNDGLVGNEGDDRLAGGDGNDGLVGNEGNDVLSGGPGNDRLDGGVGEDRLLGGPGDNRFADVDERPNVVLIQADDMTKADYWQMRRLRAFFGNGLFFHNGYVTTALCCPSRVSTLLGQYTNNHTVYRHVGPNTGWEKVRNLGLDGRMFNVWLHDAGYQTAQVGKLANNFFAERDPIPPGWTEFYGADTPASSWKLREYDGQTDRVRSYPQNWDAPGYKNWEHVMADKAVGFIRRRYDEGPLFLYYNAHAPHHPHVYAPAHRNAFTNARYPIRPNYDEADVSDKPEYVRELPRLRAGSKSFFDNKYRDRLRQMRAMEDAIYEISNELERRGELWNTYFIFLSDNGFHMGEHRLSVGKQTPYEEDHRAPFVIKGPGVPTGSRNHLVSNIDVAPTVAELTGVPIPGYRTDVDGRSLRPLLRPDPPATNVFRGHLLLEGFEGADVPSAIVPPTYRTVRSITQDYAWTKYATGEVEYYDLARDPWQMNSLHRQLNTQRREALDRKWNQLVNCAGDECRRADR